MRVLHSAQFPRPLPLSSSVAAAQGASVDWFNARLWLVTCSVDVLLLAGEWVRVRWAVRRLIREKRALETAMAIANAKSGADAATPAGASPKPPPLTMPATPLPTVPLMRASPIELKGMSTAASVTATVTATSPEAERYRIVLDELNGLIVRLRALSNELCKYACDWCTALNDIATDYAERWEWISHAFALLSALCAAKRVWLDTREAVDVAAPPSSPPVAGTKSV
jgi:hypothetical protein